VGCTEFSGQRECTESFWEGHVRAIGFFGALPGGISYDNTRVIIHATYGVWATEWPLVRTPMIFCD